MKLNGDVLVGFGDFFSEDDYFQGGGSEEIGLPIVTPRLQAPASHPVLPTGKPLTSPTLRKPINSLSSKPLTKLPVKKDPAAKKKYVSPHLLAFQNATKASKQAVDVSKHVAGKTLQYKKALTMGQHMPLVRGVLATPKLRSPAGLRPAARLPVKAMLGAVMAAKPVAHSVPHPTTGRPLTPKQKAAVARHNKATILLAKAKKAAAAAAAKAGSVGNQGLSFVKATVPTLKRDAKGRLAIMSPPSRTGTTVKGVIGYIEESGGVDNLSDQELLGLAAVVGYDPNNPPDPNYPGYLMDGSPDPDFVPTPDPNYPGYMTDGSVDPNYSGGAATYGAVDPNNPPDPNYPGYLMDGSVDPNYGMMDASGLPIDQSSSDAGVGAVRDPDGNVLYDPATDPEVVPMPVRSIDGFIMSDSSEMIGAWDGPVPDDAFVYQGTTIPPATVGSWSTFYGGKNMNRDGYYPGILWGQAGVGAGIGWMYSTDFNQPSRFVAMPMDLQKTAKVSDYSLYHLGTGPLVGHPGGPFPNMQYSIADDKWFWQSKHVSPAMAASADSKIADANAKTIAANRAAAVAVAKQMFADRVQAAEQLAAQQATNALAESAATSAANVAASQAQAQQVQAEAAQADVETQAQQALVAQQQADTAAQQLQDQLEQQAGQYLLQQTQAQDQMDQQTEQLLYQQAQQEVQQGYPSEYADDGSGYADDGSGYADDGSGYADDGSGYADDGSGYADDASMLEEADTMMPTDDELLMDDGESIPGAELMQDVDF